MLGNAACGIRDVVSAVALHHPRTLLVLGHHLVAALSPVHLGLQLAKALRIMITRNLLPAVLERHHIIIQLAVPESLVTPEQVSAAVIVHKHGGVDKAETLGQRTANGIRPGTLRIIGHSHSQSVAAVSLVAAYVPIPLAVALHTLTGPGALTLTGPLENRCVNLDTQIGPVNHILGAEQRPVLHIEVAVGAVLIVISKEIDLVTVYKRCRIRSKHCADNRVLRKSLGRQCY